MKLFLHDKEVEVLGPGPFGTWLRDMRGATHWVFDVGKAVYDHLKRQPEGLLSNECPGCTWERDHPPPPLEETDELE